eukprot:scaffold23195_cov113-Isochrysis_galbana.AAC.3
MCGIPNLGIRPNELAAELVLQGTQGHLGSGGALERLGQCAQSRLSLLRSLKGFSSRRALTRESGGVLLRSLAQRLCESVAVPIRHDARRARIP